MCSGCVLDGGDLRASSCYCLARILVTVIFSARGSQRSSLKHREAAHQRGGCADTTATVSVARVLCLSLTPTNRSSMLSAVSLRKGDSRVSVNGSPRRRGSRRYRKKLHARLRCSSHNEGSNRLLSFLLQALLFFLYDVLHLPYGIAPVTSQINRVVRTAPPNLLSCLSI